MSAKHENTKTREILGQINRLRNHVEPVWEGILGWLEITPSVLARWVVENMGRWRERRYDPMTTLLMFIGQAMSADRKINGVRLD